MFFFLRNSENSPNQGHLDIIPRLPVLKVEVALPFPFNYACLSFIDMLDFYRHVRLLLQVIFIA